MDARTLSDILYTLLVQGSVDINDVDTYITTYNLRTQAHEIYAYLNTRIDIALKTEGAQVSISRASLGTLVPDIAQTHGIDPETISTIVEPEIIGGYIIRNSHIKHDASLKTMLETLSS